ncbi:MAG: hypothetical protein PS018_11915, partial [bacterium]|nr:hypothetical protein [bacterium]
PRTTQRLLATYLDRYRPLLVLEGSPYLFPGKSSVARNRSGFGAALSEFILRQTGLKMNPHIFRHLAAKLHLRANPQQIEIVRLFLSHASSETTEKFYADMKADHAFKSYDATIQGLRATVVTPVLPPARPSRRRPRS